MPLQRPFAISVLVILFGGCASPMKPLEFPQSVTLQDPLPGQALVYLIRAPHDQLGIAVHANGRLVAVLPHGTYTAVSLPVGTYRLTSATHSSSQLFGSWEAAVPLELAVASDQRRFFYISQPSGTATSINVLPLGKGGVLPIVSQSSSPIGPRIWKETTEHEAQGLLFISKVVLPEKSAP
jgi:hypothetical protein